MYVYQSIIELLSPDILWVKGDVTLIWSPVTYPMANPKIPPTVKPETRIVHSSNDPNGLRQEVLQILTSTEQKVYKHSHWCRRLETNVSRFQFMLCNTFDSSVVNFYFNYDQDYSFIALYPHKEIEQQLSSSTSRPSNVTWCNLM